MIKYANKSSSFKYVVCDKCGKEDKIVAVIIGSGKTIYGINSIKFLIDDGIKNVRIDLCEDCFLKFSKVIKNNLVKFISI